MAAILALSTACGIDRKTTSVTSPSSTTGTTTTTTTSTSGSLVGTWSSGGGGGTVAPDQCGAFQWRVTNQTSTSIAGEFTAQCVGYTVTGSGTGQLSGQTVTVTLSGTGTASGLPACPFSLSGTGTVDGTDSITIPYTGTTCFGSVKGTETLRKSLISSASINAPTATSPANNSTISGNKPTLTVTNATRSGSVGSVIYTYQVSTDLNFGAVTLTGTSAEGSGQTSYTAVNGFSDGYYYWRARASDGTTTSGWSITQAFIVSTVVTPPATTSDILAQATILNSPHDLASWPVTTTLDVVDIRPSGIAVQFSKKDGSGRWPDVTPPGWSGALQYTLGMCLYLNNQWYCSAVVEFWYGLEASGGPPGEYALNWFYDPSRWYPMTGHQPAVGETIGFFVCAGDCRNNPYGTLSPVQERSNVVLVKMPTGAGATYRF